MTQDYKDQRVGLVVFGSLGILAGCLCGLFCLLYAAMGMGAMGAERPPVATLAQIGGFYLGLGAAFVWLGIGSILCRKWAVSIILAFGWLWLISGVIGLFMIIALRSTFDQTLATAFSQAGGTPPTAMLIMVKVIMFALFAVIYFIIPAAIVVFYGRRAIRLTCEARDPVPRWTDGIPLPALITAIMLSFFACGMIVSVPNPAWPLFTLLLKGPAAHAATFIMAALLAIAAWGAFQLRPWAWWIGLTVPIFMMLSFSVFIHTSGMAPYLDAIDAAGKQRNLLQGTPFMEPSSWTWFLIVYPVVFITLMLWVKRYFVAPASPVDRPSA